MSDATLLAIGYTCCVIVGLATAVRFYCMAAWAIRQAACSLGFRNGE